MPLLIPMALFIMSPLAQGGPPGGGGRRQQQGQPPAEDASGAPKQPQMYIPASTTHHSMNLNGGAFAYTADAAQTLLKGDTGDVECAMFNVYYTKDGGEANRPITFAFNGGPGSASMWLHLGALGPKRAPMNDDGSLPKPPYTAIDNADTWLDFTDIVMADAPGCGFSRIARQDLATKYFGVRQDVAAFTAFVKQWLTDHHRWNSPIFIAGESYGGIRGSGLSASLFQAGIAVNGFVSISGTSNYITLEGMRGNDVPYVSFFPSLSACAFYHHKLNARFKSVESVVKESQDWVDKEYSSALQRGDSLSDQEKDHVAAKMSEYLGLSKQYCLDSNLRVPESRFFRELLRKEGLTIGRYDGRLVGREEIKVGDRGSGDPSDEATNAPFTTSINAYLQDDLGIKSTIPYLNFGRVNPWEEPEGSYAETSSDLARLIQRNPYFKVLYCCSYYDLACPLNGTVYTVNHMGLDGNERKQVSYAYYPAGHMMYIEKGSRKKFHDDVKKFEQDVIASKN